MLSDAAYGEVCDRTHTSEEVVITTRTADETTYTHRVPWTAVVSDSEKTVEILLHDENAVVQSSAEAPATDPSPEYVIAAARQYLMENPDLI